MNTTLRFLFTLVLLSALPCFATPFTFASIDIPGAVATEAWGINSSGAIVGFYVDQDYIEHGYLWNGATWSTIDHPAGWKTDAYGINSAGQVVGTRYPWMTVPLPPPIGPIGPVQWPFPRGFLDAGGTFTTVEYPPAPGLPPVLADLLDSGTQPFGINASGDIVGQYRTIFDMATDQAFLLSGGTYSNINAGPGATFAYGINDAGQIVGRYTAPGQTPVGFLRTGSTVSTFACPGGEATAAHGINNSGIIVGTCAVSRDVEYGFLLDGGNFVSISFPGASSTSVYGVNDAGQIVGYYSDSLQHEHGFLATPVPEPGSAALVVFGVIALAVYARRRRAGF